MFDSPKYYKKYNKFDSWIYFTFSPISIMFYYIFLLQLHVMNKKFRPWKYLLRNSDLENTSKMTDWDDSLQFFHGMGAALFYGICSVSMAFLNKILMDIYGFDFPISILVIQMGTTIVILYTLKFLRFIELPGYTLKDGYLFALPAFFYSANSVLALLSLSHMNVAMYGVLKRCVPMVTLLLSVLILKQGLPSTLTLTSIVLLTIGCIIAGKF